jgi:deoxycytidylate deaminase
MDKWIRKYMKMAKTLADDNAACYSRKIGVILMSDDNEPIGFGYNGSITGAPHNDDPVYLAHLWKDLLSDEQKDYLKNKYAIKPAAGTDIWTWRDGDRVVCDALGEGFVKQFGNCAKCPRKLLDLKPGESLELCNCSHAERNAIFNAAARGASTKGAKLFCWCACPCHECVTAIVQSGIKEVYCLKSDLPDYSPSSRFNLKTGGVKLVEVKAEDILSDGKLNLVETK